jgi:hypothetical protein
LEGFVSRDDFRRLQPFFAAYQLTPQELPLLRDLLGLVDRKGWGDRAAHDVLRFWNAHLRGRDFDEDQMRESVRDYLLDCGWSEQATDDLLLWHDAIREHGIDEETGRIQWPDEIGNLNSRTADRQRLEEIRTAARADFDAYERDTTLQAEHREILVRLLPAGEFSAFTADDIKSPAPVTPAEARRAEIQETMRTGEYWRSEPLQREYMALLGTEAPIQDQPSGDQHVA